MTALRGICLDGRNPFGRPSVRSLKLLKVNGARMVALQDSIWFTYYRELEEAEMALAVVFTGESFEDNHPSPEKIREVCRDFMAAISPEIVVLGNESNVQHAATWPERPGGGSTAGSGDDALVEFWNIAAPVVREVRPSAKLYTSWYSDPDPIRHIRAVHSRLTVAPDGVDYHPYEEGYAEAEATLHGIRRAIGGEVIALEWNDSDPDGLRRFKQTLTNTTEHDCFFCYDDRMVPDHGVIDAQGRRKPQWYALRDALA